MEYRARVLYRRGRGCVTGTPAGCVAGVPGAVGPARPLAARAASLWLGASARSPARPCRRPQTPRLWLRRRCSGCRRARPPARRPRREPMARRVGSKPGQALRSRRHPPHRWRGCVVSGQALPPPSDTEVVAASLVFRVPSGPPARSPSALRACGSAPRLEARPGPAVPTAPSTPVARGASRAARPERGGSTASAQNYRAHDGVCEKCDGLNVSEPTEHSTIARGAHAVE